MKKLLSLVLTVALLLTLVPTVIAGAEEAAANNTLSLPITHDTYLFGDNDYVDTAPGSYGEEVHGELDHIMLMSKTGNTRRGYGVLRTDALTDLKAELDSGKAIVKVELQTYIAPGSLKTDGAQMNFFPATATWDESTINMVKWSEEGYLPHFSWADGAYGVFDEDEIPTDTYTQDYPAVDADYVSVTYDITNTFNKALESGISADSVFSFMMVRGEHTNYTYFLFASSEAVGYEPVIKVTLKEKKHEITSTTEFTGDARYIESAANGGVSGTGTAAYYFPQDSENYDSSSVVAYTIQLPQVSQGKYLESLKMKFCEASSETQRDYSNHINIYRFIPENAVDISTLYFSDVAKYAVKENRTGSVRATGNYAIRPETVEGNNAHSYIEYEADLTEYAHECLAAGKTEMIVLMNCDYTLKFCGTSGQINSAMSQDEQGSKYTVSIASNPEITLASSKIDVGGSIVDNSEFKFKTQLSSDALSFAKLYKGDEVVEEAVFTLTPSKTKIVLEPIVLDENASYKAVLCAGAEDLFGNVSGADIELASFDTTTNLTIAVPKIVTADFDAQTGSFAEAVEISSAVTAGTQIKAVTEITNNTSRNDEIFFVIVSYTGNEIKEISSVGAESIDITKKATKIYTSKTIALEEGCDSVKAFVWAQTQITPLADSKVINLD